MLNPAGISGEANSGEKKFLVQTEFASRPKPRVTTSVSLNGEVVKKIEKPWEKLPQSEEDKHEIERFLRKQHREVIRDINEKGEGFVLSKKSEFGSIGDEEKKILFPLEETGPTTFVVDRKALGLLLETMNLVAKDFVKNFGSFWVTQNLRKSKENAIKEFPFVANFYVDNNATISLIKEKEELLNENLVFSVCKWIYLFVSSSNLKTQKSCQIPSFDIRDVTAKISPSLKEIGFYDIYRKVAEGYQPKR